MFDKMSVQQSNWFTVAFERLARRDVEEESLKRNPRAHPQEPRVGQPESCKIFMAGLWNLPSPPCAKNAVTLPSLVVVGVAVCGGPLLLLGEGVVL